MLPVVSNTAVIVQVNIENASYLAMLAMLQFIYCGEVSIPNSFYVLQLTYALWMQCPILDSTTRQDLSTLANELQLDELLLFLARSREITLI